MDNDNKKLVILFDGSSADRNIELGYIKTENPDIFFENNASNYEQMTRVSVDPTLIISKINSIIGDSKEVQEVILANKHGFLRSGTTSALQDILRQNDHHGFVCTRSNQGDYRFPASEVDFSAEERFEAWKNYAIKNLNPYNIIPYPAVSLVIVRANNFVNLGGFDESFSDLSSALCELAIRWSKYGYSSVVANQVYFEVISQTSKSLNEFQILKQHEEYFLSKKNYLEMSRDPMEYFAESLSGINKKKKLLFYFLPIQPIYNGTSEYAFALLNNFAELFRDKYEISVLISKQVGVFFQADIPKNVQILLEENFKKIGHFDLVFSPVQHFYERNLAKILLLSPRNVLMIHDAIALRCLYLSQFGPAVNLNALAIELADGIISNSKSSLLDIKDYYNLNGRKDLELGFTHLAADYNFKTIHKQEIKKKQPAFLDEKYILIIGNSFKHKATKEAVSALKNLPIKKIVIGDSRFGYAVDTSDDFIFMPSGSIPEVDMQKIYEKAHLYVYPSQYEGFGLPVLKALGNQKKIFVFNNAINQELKEVFVKNAGQVTFFEYYDQLFELVSKNLAEYELAKTETPTWKEVARQVEKFISVVIEKPIKPQTVRLRWHIATLWQNKEIADYEISIYMLKDLIYRYLRRKWRRYRRNIVQFFVKSKR